MGLQFEGDWAGGDFGLLLGGKAKPPLSAGKVYQGPAGVLVPFLDLIIISGRPCTLRPLGGLLPAILP